MQRKSILVIECHVNGRVSARPTVSKMPLLLQRVTYREIDISKLENDIEQYLRDEYTILRIGQVVRLPSKSTSWE